jgi:hypothetical protein
MNLLALPLIQLVRRHHAVEHATIHILSARFPGVTLAGHSDGRGFRLYGDVPTDAVRSAVVEALTRLRTEPQLAVHPNCGTNVVSGGLLTAGMSLAVLATMSKDRRSEHPLEALPRLLMAGTLAFLANQALGPVVQQKLTTLPDPGGLRLADVQVRRRGRHVVQRVVLVDES